MSNPLDSDSATSQPRKDDPPPDIFIRLEQRGIDYEQVKRIVQFDMPQNTLRFAQWFKGRTIEEVLKYFDKWRAFLEKDSILSHSSEVKSQVEQFVFGMEWMVLQALIEANPQVGQWQLQIRIRPNDRDEKGHPIQPDQEIIVVNRETKEKKSAKIPGGKFSDLASLTAARKQAFEKLGLWDQMWKGDPSRDLITNRSPHAWPVFTKFIIPRLYEIMLPHYDVPPHHSEKLDSGKSGPGRQAHYSKELLQDMLEILKMEHDWAFKKATVRQLKAVIQRHHARKTTQTSQKPQNGIISS